MNHLRNSILLSVILGFAPAAYSQPVTAGSFEQLQVLVPVGKAVKVTDSAGSVVAGRIAALSGSQLILDVGGSKRTFDERDVLQVTHRGGDSLANGAWWGFGVGAGYGVAFFAAWCAVEACLARDLWTIPIYGAMGAGIGVGVDALIRGERAVYRAPGRAVTVVVTPMFDKRRGVGVSLVF